jgi:hypothetical protein
MRLGLIALTFIVIQNLNAQNFDGFVITNQDSLFKGYMKITLDGQKGRRILITDNKKKKPKSFHLQDLKSYAYKRDTTVILRNFYPFEGENYQVELIEAKVLISKGKVKLYYATLPNYKQQLIMIPSATGMTGYGQTLYSTYIVRDLENNLIGINKEKDKFIESIESIVGDNKELMKRIRNKELGYKDTKEIIKIYNMR